jgi:hypothetical protein
MADATDSKSVVRKDVPVQVRPRVLRNPAPPKGLAGFCVPQSCAAVRIRDGDRPRVFLVGFAIEVREDG